MNFLRSVWPIPFKVSRSSVASLIWRIVVFVVVCIIFTALMGILSHIAIVGTIFSILGSLMDLYCTVGIVLCFLVFFGVFKN